MKTISTVVLAMLLLALAACTRADRYTIVADQSQIGAGATILIEGDSGHIQFPTLPGWPHGLDADVKVVESTTSLEGGTFAVETDKHVKLTFLIAGGRYICDSCSSLNLPMAWHREAAKN